MECGEIQLHYICLGQIFKLEIIKKFYQHYLQELIVHHNCSLDVSLRDNYSVFNSLLRNSFLFPLCILVNRMFIFVALVYFPAFKLIIHIICLSK